MCSVIGYIGKSYSRARIVDGLARLEYRGYDSAGFACLDPGDHRIRYTKATGPLENLRKKFEQLPIDGFVGIGHTRWSTHGITSQENAHPHFDCKNEIAIVHNGIVENHQGIREELEKKGHAFSSQTDTEVIAHLLEDACIQEKELVFVVSSVLKQLHGAYAFVALFQNHPDLIVGVRKGSPLCVGIGKNELFLASDPLAFAGKADRVIFLPEETFVIGKRDGVVIYDFFGQDLIIPSQKIDAKWDHTEKGMFDHFMVKEIYEQKNVIHSSVRFYQSLGDCVWDNIGITPETIRTCNHISFIACGTSYYAGSIAESFFEHICTISASTFLASEFRYRPFFPHKNQLCIAISQSGETADTLGAIRRVVKEGISTIALTNVASSTMVRECDGFLLTQAGPEIAVASTKAFSVQIVALYWLAHRIALERGDITKKQLEHAEEDLLVVAEVLEDVIETYKRDIIDRVSKFYSTFKHFLFIGRGSSYAFAQEAALKLKEIAYLFVEAYAAGELKHGPLALIDDETPIFVFSHTDPVLYQKLLSNVQEIKARNAHMIVFAFQGQKELIHLADELFVLPHVTPLLSPLAMTGIMQFLVYHIARELKRPIDKPRNLAKSVTVE